MKQSKLSQALRVSAVRTYVASMVDACRAEEDRITINNAEKASIRATARDALFALRATFVTDGKIDGAAYIGACEEAHGNGLRHTAKDYVPGKLREGMEAAKINPATVKTIASVVRRIAPWICDPANFAKCFAKDGAALSLDEIYKLDPKATVTTANVAPDAAESASASASASAEMTCEQFVAKFGMLTVLRTCSAILATKKATKLESQTLQAIAEKFAA
jgi:hypothetical protein